MLILTRRAGEKVVIGDNIKVTILRVKGNQIRIGSDAPKQTPTYRQAIHNKIKAGIPHV